MWFSHRPSRTIKITCLIPDLLLIWNGCNWMVWHVICECKCCVACRLRSQSICNYKEIDAFLLESKSSGLATAPSITYRQTNVWPIGSFNVCREETMETIVCNSFFLDENWQKLTRWNPTHFYVCTCFVKNRCSPAVIKLNKRVIGRACMLYVCVCVLELRHASRKQILNESETFFVIISMHMIGAE